MPHITNQSEFQKRQKPSFCYLCGEPLNNGISLNDDHCPPEAMFKVADRINYPIKLKVHENCNHSWHVNDEKLGIFYDILHGGNKTTSPKLQKKLTFQDIETNQGVFKGITEFPLQPLVHRVIRCMHALLYYEYLPNQTKHYIHYPIPELDQSNGNQPIMHEPQTYQFADQLCIAQKTKTQDLVIANNHQFKYVCTWSKADDGTPLCFFAFDIYQLSQIAIKIKDFPKAIVGFYSTVSTPNGASKCSDLLIENTDSEILYPIL
jgi:hypothetical protein